MKTQAIIDFRERTKGTYFWKPGMNANQRRSNERRNSFHVKAVFEGKQIEVQSYWSESCRNVYTGFTVLVDGVKKNLAALRKLPPDLDFEEV